MKKLSWLLETIIVTGFVSVTIPTFAIAETVFVKYRGTVDLAPFVCQSTPQSSLVERLCYDSKERYVIVNLNGTYYHHCEVPKEVVNNWQKAESLGRYYLQNIKGRNDCRILYLPQYKK
jgi:hypothetical protein